MPKKASTEAAASLDLVELTVEQVQKAFASGIVTSEALTQAFLDRIAEFNPRYTAIVFLNPNALADARASDQRRAAGKTIGPLDGVPVVVKEPMDMVGFLTTARWGLLYSTPAPGTFPLRPGHRLSVWQAIGGAASTASGKRGHPGRAASWLT